MKSRQHNSYVRLRAKHQQLHQTMQALLESGSPVFQRYEASYHQACPTTGKATTTTKLFDAALKHRIVLVGDYHTLASAQTTFLHLAQRAVTRHKKRLVLALEFVETKHQAQVERYMRGQLSDSAFLKAIHHPYKGAFDIWPRIKPILHLAQQHQVPVVGIDSRSRAPDSLHKRDQVAAKTILKAAKQHPDSTVLCLIGQYHLAPAHLPQLVRNAPTLNNRTYVLLQNTEALFWKQHQKHGKVAKAYAHTALLGSVFNATPVTCQESFLQYVASEAQLHGLSLEELLVNAAEATL